MLDFAIIRGRFLHNFPLVHAEQVIHDDYFYKCVKSGLSSKLHVTLVI